jgi:hypothetical protein
MIFDRNWNGVYDTLEDLANPSAASNPGLSGLAGA